MSDDPLTSNEVGELRTILAMNKGPVMNPEAAQGMKNALAPDLSPEQAVAQFGPECRRMHFPQTCRWTLPDRRHIRWPAGFHDVPASLAALPWLKANGAREVTPTLEKAMKMAAEKEDRKRLSPGYQMQPWKGHL